MNRLIFTIFILLMITSAIILLMVSKIFLIQDEKDKATFINFDKLNAKYDGQNIFFIDTVRMKKRMKERPFTARQACAIESAARTNPDMNVYVMFVSRHGDKRIKVTPLISAVLSYSNVFFNLLDLKEFSKATPLEDFIRSERLQNSTFVVSHTSDALRLLVLWKYGGTYLDTDVIVKKRLDSVPSNFVCDDISNVVNGAVINLDGSNVGRRLSEFLLEDLVKNYNGTVWGSNGPMLITRVLRKLCHTNKTAEMIAKQSCDGFHLLPSRLCYPITGVKWFEYFNETFAEVVMRTVEDSIVVHFWNNLSKKTQLTMNSTAAYVQLAKQYCPKVAKVCGEFF